MAWNFPDHDTFTDRILIGEADPVSHNSILPSFLASLNHSISDSRDQKSAGDDESTLALKAIGSRIIRSPKQRVLVAPQNGPLFNKNFFLIIRHSIYRVEDSDWGGRSSLSQLRLTPTADDDQQIYACSASNPLLERAVHDAITLDVLCK